MRHLLTLFDVTADEAAEIFDLAKRMKSGLQVGRRPTMYPGRVLGMLFSKPSLRTRVSFEAGMAQLGGTAVYLGQDTGWGQRESAADFSKVLSQYVDLVVCRTGAHAIIQELARFSDSPVINGLTDLAHPCQALADLLTWDELKGSPRGKTLAFVGDGNNVAFSLAIACSIFGARFVLSSPKGYDLDPDFLSQLKSAYPDSQVEQIRNPTEAVKEADAVYTDVWASMGQEAETAQRKKDFADYQVNMALMNSAPDDAIFLHCLPAHRGDEVTDDVIDGPQSAVIQQAANRMHVQKAIMVFLMQQAGDFGVTS